MKLTKKIDSITHSDIGDTVSMPSSIDGQADFSFIAELIISARNNTLRKINEELITLYWNIGKHLSGEIQKYAWGDKYVDKAADFLKQNHPGLKGFNRRGLYRMRQFYEIYKNDSIVSALLTQLSWANHLLIMSATASAEERHFYIKKAIEENLQNALIENMKKFLLEIGRDFTFIGKEMKIQVGGSDFFLDLLFFHRGLQCLVAFELKRGKFIPEYISKMDFYLEALDRDYKKQNENPSVGIILCASADKQIVEYAMSRTISPTMVSKYKLELPDKKLLEKHLGEIAGVIANVECGS